LRHQFDDCKDQQWEESHASPCRDIYSTSFSAAWTGKACFFTPADCRLYLVLLQEAAARYECHVHAYVLMTNHVHLLATPQQSSGISFMMQRLAQGYVRTINQTCHRTGTLYRRGIVSTDLHALYRAQPAPRADGRASCGLCMVE